MTTPLERSLFTGRLQIEKDESWAEWRGKIPFLQFKKSWRVKIIPPSGGALVRFLIENKNGFQVSVYLDVFDRLGYANEPYWELYPWINGDAKRVKMDDTDELFGYLKIALQS